jgi:hypothetical protein
MNPVFTRLQALRQKAAQLKQAVDSAPAKAAQFRDAVNSTAGQLHQLRADVQGTVAALKSDTDTSLAETLVELDGGVGILARAGYELSGVDLEQGVTPRLIVHLDQLDLARTESLESLLRECAGRRTLQAIFQALIRAEALEEKVQLADLRFRGLIVHVGAVPTVRLCWRRAGELAEETAAAAVAQPAATPPPLPLPAYGASSFFERAATPQPVPAAPVAPVTEQPSSALAPTRLPGHQKPAVTEPVAATGDWRKDALARFKKMPDLSR